MTRRWLLAAVAAVTALGGACSDTTTFGAIQLNLDRPVDVSFACYGKMRQTNGHPGMGSASDKVIPTAMPLSICQALSPSLTTDTITPVPGQEQISNADNPSPVWYGFFLQSASGTVALAQWPAVPADAMFPPSLGTQQFSDTGSSLFRVLDADPLTPGKNALSIGEDPVALGTDKTGCFEITANAGSCDLSELDITSALSNIVDGNPMRPRIDRVPVVVPDGTMNPDGTPHVRRILSKPSAMILEPFRDDRDHTGDACPITPDSKAYIAYPSCHLVAEVRLRAGADGKPTATVIGGIQFDRNGTASVLADPDLPKLSSICPTECTPDPGMQPVPVADGLRPVALDYRLDPRKTPGLKPEITSKLAIGADTRATMPAAPVTVVELDLTSFDPVPGSLVPISLEGTVGVSALALSPQIGMGGDLNKASVSDETNFQAQYVYAIATDGTVRVAEVKTRKRECDTQIDARFLRNVTLLAAPQDPSLDCLPSGRPDLPRRPGARSPGIELPGGAIANSVAIIKGLTAAPKYTPPPSSTMPMPVPTPMPAQPGLLVGYFAVITASTGAVFVANVDDDYVPDTLTSAKGEAVASSPVLVMAHQLRDGLSNRDDPPKDCTSADGSGGIGAGGPRLGTVPVQQFATGTLFDDLDNQLPRLQQVACDIDHTVNKDNPLVPVTALEFGAPEVQADSMAGPATARDTAYPDLRTVSVSVRPSISSSLENWTLTYEGTLELDSTLPSTNGPSLHFGQTFVDRTGMFIEDASQPFCHMGVEPGDVVEFRGCDPAHLDADCPAGYTCYVHPASTLNVGACFLKTEAARLQDACRDFLTSVRRYTVGTDANGGTAPGKLVLSQRKHELSTTPVDGCQSDAQCDDLARAATVINQSADPFVEPVDGQVQTQWSCQADPLRKPLNGDPSLRRCVQTCTYTPPTLQNPHPQAAAPLCAKGTVCVPTALPPPNSTAGVPGVCMEGIEPPQVCLNGPQRYVVRAGEAFTVIGDQTGFVHPIITSGNRCVRDPNLDKDPLSIGRIPLTPPACGPVPTDPALARDYPFTGRIDSSRFEANPCSLTVQQFEFTSDYAACADGNPAVCANGQPPPCANGQAPLCTDGQPPPHYGTCRTPSKSAAAAVRMNVPAIKFRNRALTLTVVDPYRSSGDPRFCIGRNPGNVVTNVPMVVPGYQIAFGVKAGFSPVTLAFNAPQISPVKVVRGPTESIWVVDDGDFIGNGITDVTTRGRVFRVESVPAPPGTGSGAQMIINTMQ